jgi:nicotinamidase-related amidase
MAKVTYDKQLTALLVIDPYNDFISEGGKVWDRLKGVAEANRCIPHMLQVLNAARKADNRVFYALHRDARPGGQSPVLSESRHAGRTALCPAISLAPAAVPQPRLICPPEFGWWGPLFVPDRQFNFSLTASLCA